MANDPSSPPPSPDAGLVETITHMAFYAGWPSAVSAVTIARDVFGTDQPR